MIRRVNYRGKDAHAGRGNVDTTRAVAGKNRFLIQSIGSGHANNLIFTATVHADREHFNLIKVVPVGLTQFVAAGRYYYYPGRVSPGDSVSQPAAVIRTDKA